MIWKDRCPDSRGTAFQSNIEQLLTSQCGIKIRVGKQGESRKADSPEIIDVILSRPSMTEFASEITFRGPTIEEAIAGAIAEARTQGWITYQ